MSPKPRRAGTPTTGSSEINEDAEAVRQRRPRSPRRRGQRHLPRVQPQRSQALKFDRIVIVGAGSSLTAGIIGKYAIEDLARVPVEVEAASEFRYRHPLVDDKLLVVALSQSGETADTIAAIREARAQGAVTSSASAPHGVSMTMESDGVTHAVRP